MSENTDNGYIDVVFDIDVPETEHEELSGRSKPDQHPIEAITNLTETLEGLSTGVTEEVSARQQADNALQLEITNEATFRSNADAQLQTNITNEKNRAEGVEGSLNNLTTTNKSNLVAAINEVKSEESSSSEVLTSHIDNKNNPHEVTKAQVGLGNCDNTADIDKPISTATQSALDNITNGTTSIAYDNTTSGLSATTLQGAIDEIDSDLDNVEDLIPSAASTSNQLADKSYVDMADNNLQSQIDAISASSDVTDIVGTYAELQAYDTSTLTNDDIIKVLKDESQSGATTYYRWVVSGSSGSFVLIGSEGPYYTKAEADELYDEKQNKITSTNKLNSDLVDDSGQTNKFVTSAEKSQISTNASNITTLQSGKADKSTTYTKTEVDTIASGKANVGLDNLSEAGQMIVDTQNGTISNCILEIPQNIKMEISGSNVIIKSGSTLVDSGSTYTTFTLTSDFTTDFSSTPNGDWFLMLSRGTGGVLRSVGQQVNKTVSGATDSLAGTTYHTWFDTENKIIKRYGNNTDPTVYERGCYPCAIINVTSGVPSFAKDSKGRDMIFNGAGFIGHHAFVYPNVKALIPNEHNSDGSLKSFEYTTNSLKIVELRTTPYSETYPRNVTLSNTGNIDSVGYIKVNKISDVITQYSNYVRQYCYEDNQIYMYVNNVLSHPIELGIISYDYDGTTVSNFTIHQPYEGARDLLTDNKQDVLTSITGYDSTQTQTLKNINGVLTWVTD